MSQPDDLEAVRTIVGALEAFDATTQERVLRWVREKLGLDTSPPPPAEPPRKASGGLTQSGGPSGQRDIKKFVADKNPTTNNEFAATVAYFWRFEAAQADRKDAIGSEDLLEACRLAGRTRLQDPNKTLNNAHASGLLDRAADRGKFQISTVGENLVAMTLGGNDSAKPTRRAARSKPKATRKQKTSRTSKGKSVRRRATRARSPRNRKSS